MSSHVGLKAHFVLLVVLLAGLPESFVLRTDLLGSERHNCCIHNLRLRTPKVFWGRQIDVIFIICGLYK